MTGRITVCNLLQIFCQVKKMMALQNDLHQLGWLGQMLRGRLGHVVGWFFIYAIIIMH